MKSVLLLAALSLFSFKAIAAADHVESLIALPDGNQVYVDYQKPQPGHPTVVLLNGLTYTTESWAKFAAPLAKLAPGTGILRYDMKGMGKTLFTKKVPVSYTISLDDQVEELHMLLQHFSLNRVSLIGLSYGSGVAIAFSTRYPNLVEKLILMAPYTEAVASQDRWILSQVKTTRLMYPFNPATDDELYDFFLKQLIYSTYPSAEPVVLENPYKLEAVYRMVQGIRKFSAAKVAALLPIGSVHLMVANEDQYLDKEALENFWDAVPNMVRASRINISVTEHKIPEAIPEYAAAWVAEILTNNPKISGGRIFTGSTWNNLAKSEDTEITLRKP
ncbi:MAG: alpha/beta fold hydrolase [Bdellovibrionota bacterium]